MSFPVVDIHRRSPSIRWNGSTRDGRAMDSRDWAFVGEGGANIVVAYEGHDPDFQNHVLRIRKIANGSNIEMINRLQALQARYYDRVVNHFVGHQYALPWKPIELTPRFIRELDQKIKDSRQSRRISSARLEPDCKIGHLLPNLLQTGHPLVVELKPKWGFACSLTSKCKFCRLQASKGHGVTEYCPTGLFSGDAHSIRSSLEAMIQNPRNQFRMLKGEMQNMVVSRLQEILNNDPLLRKLKRAQHTLFSRYRGGPFPEIDDESYLDNLEQILSKPIEEWDPLTSFLTSISLEDLSIIVSFDETSHDIKLIDVDIKLPKKIVQYLAEHDLSSTLIGQV